MSIEIERKFLVNGTPWLTEGAVATPYIQGYLSTEPDRVIRVRCADTRAYITIKGQDIQHGGYKAQAAVCAEYEYEIPHIEARTLLNTLAQKPLIEKTRYALIHAGHTWTIDVFSKENAGLVLAEIELTHADEHFIKPHWLGQEVTHQMRYRNVNLVITPFTTW